MEIDQTARSMGFTQRRIMTNTIATNIEYDDPARVIQVLNPLTIAITHKPFMTSIMRARRI